MEIEGKILRINVKPKVDGEKGLPKNPVSLAKVSFAGLEGDYNHVRTRFKQGTPTRALLLMTTDRIYELRGLGWPVQFGHLGENLTITGLTYNTFNLGQEYIINGGVSIKIAEICNPCDSLSVLPYVGDRIREFKSILKGRRGWYASVLEEGEIKMGDTIRRVF